jgi:streptogramin lyase/mono/diheme cytochrome c family protein
MSARVGLAALAACALLASGAAAPATILVTDEGGQPVTTAMVTRSIPGQDRVDTSDNGYPKPGQVNRVVAQMTRFTDAAGAVTFEAADAAGEPQYRVRQQGFADQTVTVAGDAAVIEVVLERLSDPRAIADSKPANLWLSELRFDYSANPRQAREHFLRHCTFCHQQGTDSMRLPRTPEQWAGIIDRMQMYGAMAGEDFIGEAVEGLVKAHADLNERYAELPDFETWDSRLSASTISEWPIGDGYSQMHDFIVHPNGKVYVGDNLMDRIYAFDPETGEYEVFKVPHDDSAKPGGILGERMATYPKTDNTMGVHSFAIAPSDGHIFLTPSMQQELVEFDPESGEFTRHRMHEGFYPHTIRADAHDRLWFTLALSSQVAMFDRKTGKFTYYDLPARGIKEWFALQVIDWRLSMGWVGGRPDLDWDSSGFPMPYGIDVSPLDGSVWVARLYADDLARIDPESGEITMLKTPFNAPRRLRFDANGDLWIAAFSDGRIARYEPDKDRFKVFDLPVVSETPYALNVDRERGVVWVNGNQSDTIMSLHIASGTWRVFPLPKKRTFTRDIEIADDGSVYTSNSHFPAWLIEGGQPTLIRLEVGIPADPLVARGAQLYDQHCENCHARPDIKAPKRSTLQQMPFTRVARALEFGVMMQQAAHLESDDRLAIAKYLSTHSSEARDDWIAAERCKPRRPVFADAAEEDNWGFGPGNRRALEHGVNIDRDNIGDLELKWSFAVPGATEMRSQPVAAGDVLFLGTSNGNVFALDQDSGCVHWRFSADSSVRSSLNLETTSDGVNTLFFADDLGTVYAISADEGRLRWKTSLRWFPFTVISGSLAFHEDRLYVPISSFETALAGLDGYACCRSHGGVAALDTRDGTVAWEYHATPTALKIGTTGAGTDVWGPSGASVWTTPAIDAKRGVLYIGTGQNMSPPATYNSDSVIALGLETGEVDWVFQGLAGDVWNAACLVGGANCPENAGPDFDFGGAITLAATGSGEDLVLAGQKSGHVYALDPDRKGAPVWTQRISQGTSNGGIHWGLAASGDSVWATVADPPRQREGYVPKPGVYALNLADGELRWSTPVTRGCGFDPASTPRVGLAAMQDEAPADPWPDCSYYYGQSAAPLFANGLVYAGALDGKLRILDAASGEVVRVIDTKRPFDADNGVAGHGGAIDVSGVLVTGDRLFVSSGYGMFGQMPGNVLLAYKLAD